MDSIELSRLAECEQVIERGMKTFTEVGAALMEIRESKLYRQSFGTFEDYCRERWGMKQSQSYRLIDAAKVINNLESSPIGEVLPTTESQARPLARLEPEQQREAWARAIETAPDGKITANHVQNVVNEIRQFVTEPAPVTERPHVAQNSGNNEWYTPPEYIAAAYRVMGEIDLDPASSEIANKTVGAGVFYSENDNGLLHNWAGRVWMNPPYAGELIGKFCEKLAGHFVDGDISQAIVLVNNATETGWFNQLVSVADAVVFVKSRIRFLDPQGNPGAPLQGQAVIYLGENYELFLSEFAAFGWGARVWRH